MSMLEYLPLAVTVCCTFRRHDPQMEYQLDDSRPFKSRLERLGHLGLTKVYYTLDWTVLSKSPCRTKAHVPGTSLHSKMQPSLLRSHISELPNRLLALGSSFIDRRASQLGSVFSYNPRDTREQLADQGSYDRAVRSMSTSSDVGAIDTGE
jgi:hypothetical protein